MKLATCPAGFVYGGFIVLVKQQQICPKVEFLASITYMGKQLLISKKDVILTKLNLRSVYRDFDLFSLLQILGFSDRASDVRCGRCREICSGETLRFGDRLFHANCLLCLGMFKNYWEISLIKLSPRVILFSVACRSFSSLVIFGTKIFMFEIHIIFGCNQYFV